MAIECGWKEIDGRRSPAGIAVAGPFDDTTGIAGK